MKPIFTFQTFKLIALIMLLSSQTKAQTGNWGSVYTLLNTKCTGSCHTAANPSGGLVLNAAAATVYSSLVNAVPQNATAVAAGNKLVYPGRPDRSFLFRKCNLGFEPNAKALNANEGTSMPAYGSTAGPLNDKQKELIRQWINYGARSTGTQFNEQLITDYYDVNGKASFPSGPPPAPPAGQGFQLKMGPFLIAPNGEKELYQKMDLQLTSNVEVDRIENIMSPFSHHLITYRYNTAAAANAAAAGFRTQANYTNTTLVAAVQEATDLRLPQGAAFFWNNNPSLDMDSHYINYSQTQTYMAEAYLNVWTKPSGTAHQEMKTLLLPNVNISIPADQNPHSFAQSYTSNTGQVYLWGLMGHTHKYGTDYKVYKRTSTGAKSDLIYDAQCPQGIPGCANPYFDYKHIPLEYFLPQKPLTINSSAGFIHEAQYINTGANSVYFGETSNDEMMVLVAMYTTDTVGVVQGTGNSTRILQDVKVYPNPSNNFVEISLPADVPKADFVLYDLLGKQIHATSLQANDNLLELPRNAIPNGLYIYQINAADGRRTSGKIVLE